jgi:septal ring factor EnvC (AmiA/AmiB activator)
MVSQVECEALRVQKLREGLSEEEINEEIKRLKLSQIVLKKNKIEIKDLNKKIESLEKQIKDLRNKNFKLQTSINFSRADNVEKKREKIKENGDGAITSLRRIIHILNMDGKKPLTLKDLQDGCCLTGKKLLPCLKFLEDYNLIKLTKDEKGIQRWEA